MYLYSYVFLNFWVFLADKWFFFMNNLGFFKNYRMEALEDSEIRYFRSAQVSLMLLFMGKIRGKDKTSLHCSQGCRYLKEQNVSCL